MSKPIKNPPTNTLGSGYTESEVSKAIEKSGYPLQTAVAAQLRAINFKVQEEWSFIDDDTKTQRNIDIHARLDCVREFLHDKTPSRIKPHLDLLIECKKTENPYVFFLTDGTYPVRNFPLFGGFPNKEITATVEGMESTVYGLSILDALGLDLETFHSEGPQCHSMSFAKCLRNGNKLEMSGDEPYNHLLLPLLKATNYLQSQADVESPGERYEGSMIIGIGVLDAPIIGVKVEDSHHKISSIPWVRVLRHHSLSSEIIGEFEVQSAIDIVHKDFLKSYLEEQLFPFSIAFASRVIRHEEELTTGEGHITKLTEEGNMEKYLIPKGKDDS